MNIPAYHVNAFTNRHFSGNPAMVCILSEWLEDHQLQTIATENKLPATAFLVRQNKEKNIHKKENNEIKEEDAVYNTRWFTPEYEIDLCGHGTLASAHVIFNILEPNKQKIELHYPKGGLTITRESTTNVCPAQTFIQGNIENQPNNVYTMTLPSKELTPFPLSELILQGLGRKPAELFQHRSERCLAIYETEEEVSSLQPDIHLLKQIEHRGLIVSSLGKNSDFVSRTFYPKKQDYEDAVTGSSHCLLVPFWSNRLNKTKLKGLQLSKQGGELYCEYLGDSITIAGQAVLYMQGTIVL